MSREDISLLASNEAGSDAGTDVSSLPHVLVPEQHLDVVDNARHSKANFNAVVRT